MSNLNDLTTALFETLNDVRTDKIDREKAESIVRISNTLINNGKLQLAAAKFMNAEKTPEFFGLSEDNFNPQKAIAVKKQDYQDKKIFAQNLGFETVEQARGKMGNTKFEEKFKNGHQ